MHHSKRNLMNHLCLGLSKLRELTVGILANEAKCVKGPQSPRFWTRGQVASIWAAVVLLAGYGNAQAPIDLAELEQARSSLAATFDSKIEAATDAVSQEQVLIDLFGYATAASESKFVRLAAAEKAGVFAAQLGKWAQADDFGWRAIAVSAVEGLQLRLKTLEILAASVKPDSSRRQYCDLATNVARAELEEQLVRRRCELLAAGGVDPKAPEDPKASEDVGRMMACQLGDWSQGLVFLQKSPDARWRNMALAEAAMPSTYAGIRKCATGWLGLAKLLKGKEQAAVAGHALSLLAQARPLVGNDEKALQSLIADQGNALCMAISAQKETVKFPAQVVYDANRYFTFPSRSFALSKDGSIIAVVNDGESKLHFYNSKDGTEISAVSAAHSQQSQGYGLGLYMAYNGSLAMVDVGDKLKLVDVREGLVLREYKAEEGRELICYAFLGKSRCAAMVDGDQLVVRDLEEEADLGVLYSYGQERYLIVRNDWRRALLWRTDRDFSLVNMTTKAVLSKWKLPGTFSQMLFLDNTDYCLFVEYQGKGAMCIIDTRSGEVVLDLPSDPPLPIDNVDLSPGGSILLYTNRIGATFLSLQTLKVLGTATTGVQSQSVRFGKRADEFYLVGRYGRGFTRFKLGGK